MTHVLCCASFFHGIAFSHIKKGTKIIFTIYIRLHTCVHMILVCYRQPVVVGKFQRTIYRFLKFANYQKSSSYISIRIINFTRIYTIILILICRYQRHLYIYLRVEHGNSDRLNLKFTINTTFSMIFFN